MTTIDEDARAKVNLYLQVVGKRDDGYHLLDSLVIFPLIGDRVTVSASNELSLSMDGPFSAALSSQVNHENLVLKAASLLREKANITCGASLHLKKNLPIASGIGGGSADAAACLRALNRLWDLNWSLEQLASLGREIGADVPACVYSKTLHMSGIGDEICLIDDFSLPPILLVNPGVHVSTPSVFNALSKNDWSGPSSNPRDFTDNRNDLQPAAICLTPEIQAVLDQLSQSSGVLISRMSGSGATCFALFDCEESKTAAAERLQLETNWVILG